MGILMKTENPKIYLASPRGFDEAGRSFLSEKMMPLIESKGFQVINPFELTPQEIFTEAENIPNYNQRAKALGKVSLLAGKNNDDAIGISDALLAILDGQEIDSGVASEIGRAYSLGKPILGYRSDFRQSGENIGVPFNLQVYYYLKNAKGGNIVSSLEELDTELDYFYNLIIK